MAYSQTTEACCGGFAKLVTGRSELVAVRLRTRRVTCFSAVLTLTQYLSFAFYICMRGGCSTVQQEKMQVSSPSHDTSFSSVRCAVHVWCGMIPIRKSGIHSCMHTPQERRFPSIRRYIRMCMRPRGPSGCATRATATNTRVHFSARIPRSIIAGMYTYTYTQRETSASSHDLNQSTWHISSPVSAFMCYDPNRDVQPPAHANVRASFASCTPQLHPHVFHTIK